MRVFKQLIICSVRQEQVSLSRAIWFGENVINALTIYSLCGITRWKTIIMDRWQQCFKWLKLPQRVKMRPNVSRRSVPLVATNYPILLGWWADIPAAIVIRNMNYQECDWANGSVWIITSESHFPIVNFGQFPLSHTAAGIRLFLEVLFIFFKKFLFQFSSCLAAQQL